MKELKENSTSRSGGLFDKMNFYGSIIRGFLVWYIPSRDPLQSRLPHQRSYILKRLPSAGRDHDFIRAEWIARSACKYVQLVLSLPSSLTSTKYQGNPINVIQPTEISV